MKNDHIIEFKTNAISHLPTKWLINKFLTLFFSISVIFVPCSMLQAAPSGVKWHPGHYYTIMGWGKNNPAHLAQVFNELKSTPSLRGLQIRYLWAELETAEGKYDFTAIDKRLNELAAQKKRLVIQVQTKSFDPNWKLVPDYLKAEKYEGGVFAFSNHGKKTQRGENIKLWNPYVRDRLSALFTALGKRYNSHPYFEGIGMIETALGQAMTRLSNTEIDGFYKNLLTVHQQMRVDFPNTMTIQEVNYPNSILETFIAKLEKIGTTLSGPDIFLDEPGLNFKGTKNSMKGVYHYYPNLSGIVPLAPSIMQSNYANTRHNKTGRVPTIHDLLSFARDKLKANYIFWTREPNHYSRVLAILNEPEQTRDPAGGLSSICPKAYSSCIE